MPEPPGCGADSVGGAEPSACGSRRRTGGRADGLDRGRGGGRAVAGARVGVDTGDQGGCGGEGAAGRVGGGSAAEWPGLALDVLGPLPAESWPVGDDPSGTVVNNSSLVLRAHDDGRSRAVDRRCGAGSTGGPAGVRSGLESGCAQDSASRKQVLGARVPGCCACQDRGSERGGREIRTVTRARSPWAA